MVGSEKLRHGLTLSKDVKNNEKGFYRYIIQKKKTKEIVLLSDKWDKVLKEPADSVAKPLFIIFEKSHQLGKIISDQKNRNIVSIFKKDKLRTLGTTC